MLRLLRRKKSEEKEPNVGLEKFGCVTMGAFDDNRPFFDRMRNEGYTEVALGAGPWVGNVRVLAMRAFYHPDGRISTMQQPKLDDGAHTRYGVPVVIRYASQAELDEHIRKYRIAMGEKANLVDLMGKMDKRDERLGRLSPA